MKKLLFSIIVAGSIGQAHAQVPIPMQGVGVQLQSPLLMMQQAEQIRAMRFQAEQSAAQRRLIDEQARAQQIQNRQQENAERIRNSQPSQAQSDPVIDEWLRAAGPRMHIYPDFEKVVFAPDVTITVDMIRLMTSSEWAADIAYYFATHKAESWAVSKMSLQEAARSIDRIESSFQKSPKPEAPKTK